MKSYDRDKLFVYIIYIDENNLYEWEIIQDLLTYEF